MPAFASWSNLLGVLLIAAAVAVFGGAVGLAIGTAAILLVFGFYSSTRDWVGPHVPFWEERQLWIAWVLVDGSGGSRCAFGIVVQKRQTWPWGTSAFSRDVSAGLTFVIGAKIQAGNGGESAALSELATEGLRERIGNWFIADGLRDAPVLLSPLGLPTGNSTATLREAPSGS